MSQHPFVNASLWSRSASAYLRLVLMASVVQLSCGTQKHGVTPIHEIQVRLANGISSEQEGRVEVFWHGTWGTICDDSWDDNDAKVVCRMLNFEGGTAVSRAYFGEGTGPVLLTDVGCMGDESTLNQCPIGYMVTNCGHSEDAGVKCDLPVSAHGAGEDSGSGTERPDAVPTTTLEPDRYTCSTFPRRLRLLGKPGEIWAGWVQVLASNGTWGLVCDDNWNLQAAQVVCRELCFSPLEAEAGWLVSSMQPPSMAIVLDDVVCSGRETSLLQCTHAPEFTHDCGPSELASVSCKRIGPPAAVPPPEPTMECREQDMLVAFMRSRDPNMTERHLTVQRAYSNGGQCVPIIGTNYTHVTIALSYSNCAHISQNETHLTYTSGVVVPSTTRSEPQGAMSRDLEYIVTLTCDMARGDSAGRSLVSPTTQKVKAAANGSFVIVMNLFSDGRFTSPIISQGPIIFPSGSWVNVALTLKTLDPRLKLIVSDCMAAPDPAASSVPAQVLLRNKCPVESTLSVHPISDVMFGFRFQPFSFVGSANMTVKCSTYVCVKSEPSKNPSSDCDRSCINGKAAKPRLTSKRNVRRDAMGRGRWTVPRWTPTAAVRGQQHSSATLKVPRLHNPPAGAEKSARLGPVQSQRAEIRFRFRGRRKEPDIQPHV